MTSYRYSSDLTVLVPDGTAHGVKAENMLMGMIKLDGRKYANGEWSSNKWDQEGRENLSSFDI